MHSGHTFAFRSGDDVDAQVRKQELTFEQLGLLRFQRWMLPQRTTLASLLRPGQSFGLYHHRSSHMKLETEP